MAIDLFANNATSTLAGPITSSALTANLATGTGVEFPAPAANQYFVGTFVDQATGLLNEIVSVTNVTGDVITMTRAQEGTTALNWLAGDIFASFWTAGQAGIMVQQGQAQSQSGNYAVDTGSANAYACTLTPALTAHTVGMPIRVKILNTSTGASTFNPGPGVKSITNIDGSAISGAELPAGGIVTFLYDGTNYQASATQVSLASDIGSVSGDLLIVNDGSTPNTKINITASAAVLVNASGNSFKIRSVTQSIDYTTNGAGGLDTGSLANNTWYYDYLIYNSSTLTTSALGSLSATAPTLPSGYTYFKRVGAERTDGSAHLYRAKQDHDFKQWLVGTNPATPFVAASGATGMNYTSGGVFVDVSLAAYMPPTARTVAGILSSTGANSSGTMVAPSSSWPTPASYPQGVAATSGASGVTDTIPFEILCETAQQVTYMSNVASATIAVQGYYDTI